jgi:hypothetical protein
MTLSRRRFVFSDDELRLAALTHLCCSHETHLRLCCITLSSYFCHKNTSFNLCLLISSLCQLQNRQKSYSALCSLCYVRIDNLHSAPATMAARNRNRPGLVKEDADEERSLWNQIRSESKRIDDLVVRIIFIFCIGSLQPFCLFDLVPCIAYGILLTGHTS